MRNTCCMACPQYRIKEVENRSVLTGAPRYNLNEKFAVESFLGERLEDMITDKELGRQIAQSDAVICHRPDTPQDHFERVTFEQLNQLVALASDQLLDKLLKVDIFKNIADGAKFSNRKIAKNKQRTLMIALHMSPGLNRIVVQLACMKLRIGFIPMDKRTPIELAKNLFPECKTVVVITDDLATFKAEKDILFTGELSAWENLDSFHRGSKDIPMNTRVTKTLFATVKNPVIMVLFTSGSTSTVPKGVVLTNKQLYNRLAWQWSNDSPMSFLKGPSLTKTNWLFVDAFTELFGALLGGRCVVVPQNEASLSGAQSISNLVSLAKIVQKFSVQHITTVPAQLQIWIEELNSEPPAFKECYLASVSSIRILTVSGQMLTPKLAVSFFECFQRKNNEDNIRLVNLYGSTEVAGDVTVATFDSSENVRQRSNAEQIRGLDGKVIIKGSILPVGKPIFNTEIYVVVEAKEKKRSQAQHRLARLNEVGEIYVSGAPVPHEICIYTNNSGISVYKNGETVMQAQLENNLNPRLGFRTLFRTGDIGFVSTLKNTNQVDFELFVCGRIDDLVKANGIKCHLGNIDALLARCPLCTSLVQKSLTLPVESNCDGVSQTKIVCFFQRPASRQEPVDVQEIKQILRQQQPLLSEVNVIFVEIPHFPLKNISGKVDSIQLKQKYLEGFYENHSKNRTILPYPTSLNKERERARAVFAKFLGLDVQTKDNLRPHDDEDYFNLGGDSLTAVLIVSELNRLGIPSKISSFNSSSKIGLLLDSFTCTNKFEISNAPVAFKQEFIFQWVPGETFKGNPALEAQCKELVCNILSEAFITREPICQSIGLKKETFYRYVHEILTNVEPSSLLILLAGYKTDNEIVTNEDVEPETLLPLVQAVSFSMREDHNNKPDSETKHNLPDDELMATITSFLDYVCELGAFAVKDEVIFDHHMLGVVQGAGEPYEVYFRKCLALATALETNIVEKAKRAGITIIRTINTNQVTEEICKELGYTQIKVVDFVSYAIGRGIKCNKAINEIKCYYAIKRL